MSRRFSTLRPPISTLTTFGIVGSGSDRSSCVRVAANSSELLPSLLLILSVDESDERVDEQLDDFASVASVTIVVSGSVASDGGNGELVDGLSTSSVGVVGGEDGFCGS